ncbi:MAG TPA: hypothetical protein DDX98_01435 [Bacteroidales bacterium]|jgi:peptidyl-prolyl cis-trans isomerase D|nr:hypothetical protein [Bacteroidales bacterium]
MAAIQKLRNNAGLLIIVIGVALFAFIIGEFLTSGGGQRAGRRNNIAVVNGKGISFDAFQRIIDEEENLAKMQRGSTALDAQTTQEIRSRAWTDMIQNLVLDREFEKLGLTISGEELFDMVSGENPHPFIMQFFADPNTGRVNRQALSGFLQSVNDLEAGNQQKVFWLYLEDLIYKERKNQKYNTLLRKGLYATNLETKRRHEELNTSVNFDYIVKRYSEVNDSTIAVSETELKEYYKAHKNEFKQQQSRDIRYVVWEVVPSQEDVKRAEAWINDVKGEFESIPAENSFQYASANSDIAPTETNFTNGEFDNAELNEFAFSANEGNVFGPYFEDNHFKLAKLAKVDYLPDSVKASHILLQYEQTQESFDQTRLLADSLKKLIDGGSSFAALARENSKDEANAFDGGDLGWFKEGQMVAAFNDSCFYGKTGDVKLVYTQFGIHIVKINAQSRNVKKVKVAELARQVRPSEETDQSYFTKASEFGAVYNTKEKFEQAIKDQKAVAQSYNNLTVDAIGITGIDNSRSLVQWAFRNDEGSVSKRVMEYDNKYVVALIDKVREEGVKPIEDVKYDIEQEVRKQKKAALLKADLEDVLAEASDIQSVANALNLQVQNANNVRFTSFQIQNLGTEPQLQAAAISLEPGVLSPAIEGTNGVYVLQVEDKDAPSEEADYSSSRNFLDRSYATRVNYGSMKVLNELAGVEDYRIDYF